MPKFKLQLQLFQIRLPIPPNRVPLQFRPYGRISFCPSQVILFLSSQIRKRLRIWLGMPIQLPQLGHGVEAARHAADDLAGGGPGVAAVVDAAAEATAVTLERESDHQDTVQHKNR